MFTRRRKSWKQSTWKQNGWNQSTWKRKNKRHSWVPLVLLLLGLPIGLELLARLVVTLTGASQQFEVTQSEQDRKVESYRLKFLSPAGQPYSKLPGSGELSAVRNSLMGYQLAPQQKSQFWAINPQGFRDTDAVTPEKPPGEMRIFVLGGSMAFGQLSSSNQTTFAHQLEELLNNQVARQRSSPSRFQPAVLPYLAEDVDKALTLPPRIVDRQYRVINAAVPGYTSGNELAMLIQQVANYNPDLVILLDSYGDLVLPSSQSGADIPGIDQVLQGEVQEAQGLEAVKGEITHWFEQLYLVRGFRQYLLRSPQPQPASTATLNLPIANVTLDQALAIDPAELDRRVDRYQNHLLQMVRWSSATKKRLLIGIQPEISDRQSLTPEETVILSQLGTAYSEKIKAGYAELTAAADKVANTSPNVKLLDLHDLYAKTPEQAFQSPTSLTDAANQQLAEQFYQAIAPTLAIQPKPFGS
ncbi:MAG: SGNH/GDSL hydrolase family protein [Drouetiella hepatica Uher 2000/2452]|jgi:hypothetical protein|uniref:SGNH/GDSL hydrolase family protein n=1 Tax=Drouetiella hepatica Uher 2000/2452 TaxID=904376 RepID=A0A951QBI0_9CYAN|nr:SGNH/GDSL hydrolase family protein [Drouetiella hepatica Uher 2000/2452]